MSAGPAAEVQWTPAFPGQRPPFAPGNELTLRHGAYSPRKINPRAEEIVEHLLAGGSTVAYLSAPEYRASVWRYAQRQARADLLHDHLVTHGEGCPGCDDCLAWESRWRDLDAQAEKAAVQLGLTPMSRARLGRDVAQASAADAAAALTAMREQHERATAAQPARASDVAGEVTEGEGDDAPPAEDGEGER